LSAGEYMAIFARGYAAALGCKRSLSRDMKMPR